MTTLEPLEIREMEVLNEFHRFCRQFDLREFSSDDLRYWLKLKKWTKRLVDEKGNLNMGGLLQKSLRATNSFHRTKLVGYTQSMYLKNHGRAIRLYEWET